MRIMQRTLPDARCFARFALGLNTKAFTTHRHEPIPLEQDRCLPQFRAGEALAHPDCTDQPNDGIR